MYRLRGSDVLFGSVIVRQLGDSVQVWLPNVECDTSTSFRRGNRPRGNYAKALDYVNGLGVEFSHSFELPSYDDPDFCFQVAVYHHAK